MDIMNCESFRNMIFPKFSYILFTTAARWRVVVIESKSCLLDCLLDLPTFSYIPTKATRDIVVEGDELDVLEEVKTRKKTILELG